MLHRSKVGNIGPIMPILSWRVSRALAEVNYWGQIKDSKFENSPNIYDYSAMTAAHTCAIFHIPTNTLALSMIEKIVEILHFHIWSILDLGRHLKFERLLIVWGHWTMTTGPKYVISHNCWEK